MKMFGFCYCCPASVLLMKTLRSYGTVDHKSDDDRHYTYGDEQGHDESQYVNSCCPKALQLKRMQNDN